MAEAVRVNTDEHLRTGVRWPANTELFFLQEPFQTADGVKYSYCVVADHLDGCVAVGVNNHGDPRPIWPVLGTSDKHDHAELLHAMGYDDIFDEQ